MRNDVSGEALEGLLLVCQKGGVFSRPSWRVVVVACTVVSFMAMLGVEMMMLRVKRMPLRVADWS